jgi:hypothetical protein
VTQPVDSSILHEIVRVIDSRRKVPEKVVVKAREYLLTYLDDHQRRLEEALQRFDADRLNMLYGQLASKIKYQLLRRVPAKAEPATQVKKKTPAKVAPAKRTAKAAPKAKPKAKPRAAKQPASKAKKGAKPAAKRSRPKPRQAAGRRR